MPGTGRPETMKMRVVFDRMGLGRWQVKVDIAWCVEPEDEFDLDVARNPRLYRPGEYV